MEAKIFNALGFRVEIEEVIHLDGRVLVFHIPSRPQGTAYSIKRTYWMRAGSELKPMSKDCLRSIFGEGKPDWLEEHSKKQLSALQVVELLDTQTYFDLLGLPYPSDRSGVLDRLIREQLVDKVSETYLSTTMASKDYFLLNH